MSSATTTEIAKIAAVLRKSPALGVSSRSVSPQVTADRVTRPTPVLMVRRFFSCSAYYHLISSLRSALDLTPFTGSTTTATVAELEVAGP